MKIILTMLLLPLILALGHSKNKIVPPGTNHLINNLYIDIDEMSNIGWQEYMYWTSRIYGSNSLEFKNTLPDTLVWRNLIRELKLTDNEKSKKFAIETEKLIEIYLRHPAYQNYPVVGISYSQALQYCNWRTKVVNQMFYLKAHKYTKLPIDSNIEIPQKVIYRLPNEKEWELAASAGLVSKNENLYYNTKMTDSLQFQIPWPNNVAKKDKGGRRNLMGNVAEMINAEGLSKGGGFIHSTDSCQYKFSIPYSRPEYWLGFRCVAELVEK